MLECAFCLCQRERYGWKREKKRKKGENIYSVKIEEEEEENMAEKRERQRRWWRGGEKRTWGGVSGDKKREKEKMK